MLVLRALPVLIKTACNPDPAISVSNISVCLCKCVGFFENYGTKLTLKKIQQCNKNKRQHQFCLHFTRLETKLKLLSVY